MKKFISTIVLFATFTIIFAQTKEEIQSSKERLEKINKLETPKATAIQSLDELNNKIGSSALEASAITPLLQNLYYRSIGENNDGIADVTVKKPTLKECEELAKRIFSQSENIQGITSSFSSVSEEAKTIKNPLKLAKVASSVGYAKTAISLLGQETVFQSTAIKSIIQTLNSSDNL